MGTVDVSGAPSECVHEKVWWRIPPHGKWKFTEACQIWKKQRRLKEKEDRVDFHNEYCEKCDNGGDLICWTSDDAPPEVIEQFLKNILVYEEAREIQEIEHSLEVSF